MNTLLKKLLVGLTVLGLGTATLAAHAEKSECEHMGGPMSMGEHGGGKFAEHMKARMAKHQAELHDKLKLSAAQEAGWKTFTAAMMPPDEVKNAAKHADERAAMEKLSAPERMEKMMSRMKQGEAHMETRLAALKTFYATLSADQKKVFDENVGPHHEHHHDEAKK